MPVRGSARRRMAGILGCAVVLTATVIGVRYGFFGAGRGGPRPHASAGAAIHEKSPLADLNEGLRNHDPRALVFIQQRVTPQADAPREALSDEEAGAWLETL